MEQQPEITEKPKKEKKSSIPKEKVERGGSKKWVMIILVATIFLSLVFYLLSGNLKITGPHFGIRTDFFSGMQEAKYSY